MIRMIDGEDRTTVGYSTTTNLFNITKGTGASGWLPIFTTPVYRTFSGHRSNPNANGPANAGRKFLY